MFNQDKIVRVVIKRNVLLIIKRNVLLIIKLNVLLIIKLNVLLIITKIKHFIDKNKITECLKKWCNSFSTD